MIDLSILNYFEHKEIKEQNAYYAEAYSELCQPEKCPNTEFFLLRISLHSDWIRRFTE